MQIIMHRSSYCRYAKINSKHVFLFFNDKIWKCSDWRKIPNAYIKFQNYQSIFPLKQKSISLYIIPHEQLKNKLYIQMCFSH